MAPYDFLHQLLHQMHSVCIQSKNTQIETPQDLQKINLKLFCTLLTPLIIKKQFQASCDQIHTDGHMDAGENMHAGPTILTQDIPQTLCRMNRNVMKLRVSYQCLHILCLPLSSTSSCTSFLGKCLIISDLYSPWPMSCTPIVCPCSHFCQVPVPPAHIKLPAQPCSVEEVRLLFMLSYSKVRLFLCTLYVLWVGIWNLNWKTVYTSAYWEWLCVIQLKMIRLCLSITQTKT